MMIPLKSYDIAAAKRRIRAKVSLDRGLGFSNYTTDLIRTLDGACGAASSVGWALINALAILPIRDGGAATAEGAWLHEVRPELPLVRALMIVRGHPCHPGFGHLPFRRPGQAPILDDRAGGPHDVGAALERMFAESPQPWDLAKLDATIFEGACAAYGNEEVDEGWEINQIYPGSRISHYMHVLVDTAILDAFGAFDPAFTRQDAMSGEWWLLQPVSPRLNNHELAGRMELTLAGYLPQSHVDAPGRVVMACYPRGHIPDEEREDRILDSKWIAGFERVLWRKNRPPLSDPGFKLEPTLVGVTPTSYGPYRHSSELPAFGDRA